MVEALGAWRWMRLGSHADPAPHLTAVVSGEGDQGERSACSGQGVWKGGPVPSPLWAEAGE